MPSPSENAVPPAPAGTPKPPEEARLAIFEADVTSHVLSRRAVTCADGRRHLLFLAVPTKPAPPSGFPLLSMLDGNAAFDALTPALLAAVPGLALAGIGYDTTLRFDRAARALDYTPPRDGSAGGADAFLDRLLTELLPEAARALPVDAGRRSLWGHSLAGLCALYALLARPGTFSRIVAASPSLWWGDEFLLALEERTPAEACGRAEILVMLGDSERRSSPSGPHWEGPAPHTLEMVRRLGLRDGLDISCRVFEGAGHAATLPASLPWALDFAAR